MKNSCIPFVFLLISLLTLNLHCKENDGGVFPDPPSPKMPAATQTGANTFGCYVNGKLWLPTEFLFVDYQDGTLLVSAKNMKVPHSKVKIYIADVVFSKDTYNIGDDTPSLTEGSYSSDMDFYYTDAIYTGKITLTRFDTINYIISGTFSFDAKHFSTGEIIHITGGRFDSKYN
jgi:hypothetical protein